MSLTAPLYSVEIETQPAVVVSEKYFEEAGIKRVHDNFPGPFLGMEAPAITDSVLKAQGIEISSNTHYIHEELGERAQISIQEFVGFLKKGRRSSGAYVFYIRGRDGDLFAVFCRWIHEINGWVAFSSLVRFCVSLRTVEVVVSRN